jgi:hexosaminidase
MIKKIFIVYKFAFLLFTAIIQLSSNNVYSQNIIPQPVKIEIKDGYFELNERTILAPNSKETYNDALIFNDYLKNLYGLELKIEMLSAIENNVIILEKIIRADIPPDSYEMIIGKFDIRISGMCVYNGLQTLKQLLSFENIKIHKIPCLYILDYPLFNYRGMHLDVCRHFFPKEFIKKYIDYIAMYKMNYFHWHLTDDQGWRIEIKKYPKLTEIGAFRKGTLTGKYKDKSREYDTLRYGGYYTQDDIKEIVAYAGERHITIIPEIEMPGHSVAALASYPEFSCTGGPFEVEREWGVFDDIYCPKEETFKFLEDVLSEVIELFPGRFIHIGGDEAPKTRWENCKHCRELIKKEGLKNENELQSYFIKRVEKFLNSKGKTIIGWDEILEGGLAPNAIVMSWRGFEGGVEAAKQNHKVIMTPGSYCYFDHYQGDPRNEPIAIGGYTTLEKVYSFNPVPEQLTGEQKYLILGAQGNVWTEYIITPDKVEYMVFPRICALAEVLWTPKEKRNFINFKERIRYHFSLLDKLKISYSKAIYDLRLKYQQSKNKIGLAVEITAPFSNSEVYYTLNNSEPDINSTKYTAQIILNKSCTLKAANYENGIKIGKTYLQEFKINKATGKDITLLKQPAKRYSVGGAFSLVDGVEGVLPWSGRDWLGFLGDDLNAVIDLGKEQEISQVIVDVLNAEISWIYLPKEIEILVSDDGVNFSSIKKVDWDFIKKFERNVLINFSNINARYIKVIAKNFGKIPKGKPGEGTDAWLFVDEIQIN